MSVTEFILLTKGINFPLVVVKFEGFPKGYFLFRCPVNTNAKMIGLHVRNQLLKI